MSIKKYFFFLLCVILITDLTIVLDIPILRPVLAFICYMVVPGMLILHILRLYDVDVLYKFVVIIGLSVSFLLFFGLLINTLYLSLGLSNPLSTQSLVISFTIILIISLFIAYKRNENDFQIQKIFNFKLNVKKGYSSSLLVFPILFPFLSVFGSHLMNEQQDNRILILMLFLIVIYVLAIVYLRRKISDLTYPLALFNMALAVVLMHGLTSNYINGRDVHIEYYSFCVVAENLYWSISNFHHAYMACLSTSILPTVYWSLLGVDKLYIYKLYYQLIWAIVPVSCYVLYKNYVSNLSAFLSSFLIISQTAFIYTLQSAMRTEFSLFFLILTMVTFFNKNISEANKKILFIIFSFSMILSHYSTSYIFLFLIVFYFIISNVYNHLDSKFSATLIILIFMQIFLWYGQLADVTFSDGTLLIVHTFEHLMDIFVDDLRSPDAYTVFGSTVTNSTKRISVIVFDIIIGITAFGLVSSMISNNSKSIKEYSIISLISYLIVSSYILLPFISTGYGPQRIYLQGLLLFAPFFIVGSESILNLINRKNLCLFFITLLIVSQFFCGTYLLHQLYGIPHSEDLNREGGAYWEYFIHDQEVTATKWLSFHNPLNKVIYTDFSGATRIRLGYGTKRPIIRSDFFEKNESLDKGYIYLRRFNVFNGLIQAGGNNEDNKPISDYSYLFNKKCKLYDNGGSEIWN